MKISCIKGAAIRLAIHQFVEFVSKQNKQFYKKSNSKMKYFALFALLAVIVAAAFAEPVSPPGPVDVTDSQDLPKVRVYRAAPGAANSKQWQKRLVRLD